MDNLNISNKLTFYDKISVFIYRISILISCILITISVYHFYAILNDNQKILTLFNHKIEFFLFWSFVVAIGFSVSYLHLYNKKILKFIKTLYIIGVFILLLLFIFEEFDSILINKIILSKDFNGKIGVIAIGLILSSFSAITAKEAFCFKLYEGYIISIFNVILIFVHFFRILPLKIELILLAIINLCALIFCFRKLKLPLHYDIGDKTKYK